MVIQRMLENIIYILGRNICNSFAKFTQYIMRERYSELRSESGSRQRENGNPDLSLFIFFLRKEK